MFINGQNELVAFVERARSSSILAIDTEFLREKTYYPKLCLLQMATDDEWVIVDPFQVKNLRVLEPLLTDPQIVKLFHAAGQDLEILYHEVGCMCSPVFDTQIAAALLGHTLQIGYGALVSSVCHVSLKKADSFTDWSRRPLTESQVSYAADDVIYLPKLYHEMTAQLKRLGRLHWLDGDFAELSDAARFEEDPRERFRRLKRANTLSRRQLSAARELAAWREELARRVNRPRKWILSDEQIVEACRRGPRTIDDLFMIRGIREHLSTQQAREVLSVLARGFSLPESEWPEEEHHSRSEACVDAEVDVMYALVKKRARAEGIAYQTLASSKDLASIARGYRTSEVLRGWRREIVGEDLLRLVNGEVIVQFRNGSIEFI